jgi:hypothetical protein
MSESTVRSICIGIGSALISSAFFDFPEPGWLVLALGLNLVAAGVRS